MPPATSALTSMVWRISLRSRRYLMQIRGEQLEQLVRDVGMKPGHAMKFKAFLAGEQRQRAGA